MKQIVCDICNRPIDKTEIRGQIDISDNTSDEFDRYDICLSCYTDIRVFITKLSEDKQTSDCKATETGGIE